MSGYLMRLVMRGRETSGAQSMQPVVRTTSPVAERDQRIGMMGFEGFELGEASFAEPGSEAGAEREDILQPPVPPSVMTAGETRRATVLRKLASPPTGTAEPATPKARAGTTAAEPQMQTGVQSPSSDLPTPDLAGADDVPMSSSVPPMVYPAKDVVADSEGSVSSTGGIHPEDLSLDDSQTGSVSRRFDPAAVHTRSVRQTRQTDATRLEPSPGALAKHFKPPLERASARRTDANDGPRVVIGRINVEVVPPPAAPPSTAAPRPGPLTAASVSVIGPLGGGIRPSLRLSLRNR